MNKNYIYNNGEQRIITRLKLKDGENAPAPVNIDTGATVQATLYQGDCAETSTITVLSTTDDSDWANGVIVPVFPSSDMELLTVGKTAEMQVLAIRYQSIMQGGRLPALS